MGVASALRVQRHRRLATAAIAAVHGQLPAQLAEHRVRSATRPLDPGATAMITDPRPMRRLQRFQFALKVTYARAKLLKFAGLLLALRLKNGVRAFQCAVLLRDEPQSLLQDRRRAVFVDQRLKQFQHHIASHSLDELARAARED